MPRTASSPSTTRTFASRSGACEGDIDLSRSLLEATLETGTPCPVSASAITDPKVGAELVDAGFRGLLIGTGLLLADSVQGWVDDFERHRSALADAKAASGRGGSP